MTPPPSAFKKISDVRGRVLLGCTSEGAPDVRPGDPQMYVRGTPGRAFEDGTYIHPSFPPTYIPDFPRHTSQPAAFSLDKSSRASYAAEQLFTSEKRSLSYWNF